MVRDEESGRKLGLVGPDSDCEILAFILSEMRKHRRILSRGMTISDLHVKDHPVCSAEIKR